MHYARTSYGISHVLECCIVADVAELYLTISRDTRMTAAVSRDPNQS